MPIDFEIYKTNGAFSKSVPRLQLFWDSVSIGALKKCKKYYYYLIVLGIRSHAQNAHLEFGILIHSALERYDHAKLSGLDHNSCVLAAVKYAMKNTWDHTFQRPTLNYHELKNRRNLIRTIVWYCDNYQHDPMEIIELTSGKPAVELSFRIPLGIWADNDLVEDQFYLCGHIDKISKFSDCAVISDKKSTKYALDDRFFDGFTPDNQISGYNFAGQIISPSPIKDIVIDGIQIGQTFNRFERRTISRTPEQLEEWHNDLKTYLLEAELCATNNSYPMNEKACYGCEMRGICSKPKSLRDDWLKIGYSQRIWDPTLTRGDI